MTTITSKTVEVPRPTEEIFEYLSDLSNFKELLPQDKISDWEGQEDRCSFKVQKMAIIPLVKESTEKPNLIHIISGEKAPFPFTLDIKLEDVDGKTKGHMEFNGEMNAFLKMMAERPLTNLFNYIADKLVEVKS